ISVRFLYVFFFKQKTAYEITQKVAQAEILAGARTEIWGYEGLMPGPTLNTVRGRKVSVLHRNELPVPAVVHLHGAHAAPEHDGYPTDLVLPAAADGRGH